MEYEQLDIDGELLQMENHNAAEDLNALGLSLEDEDAALLENNNLANSMGLETRGGDPKFVSSLEQQSGDDNSLSNEGGDDIVEQTPTTDTNPASTDVEDPDADLISIILKSKGINDPNKINYEDEDGVVTQRSFNDLDYEEQISLLTSSEEIESEEGDFQLNDQETELISYLRENNLTVEQLLAKQRENIIEEFSDQVGKIDFDAISDDDLYILDLQSEYNLTQEEAEITLAQQKEYPEVLAKKINKLRADYKEAEQMKEQEAERAILEEQEAQYKEFSNSMFNAAKEVNSIGGLTLNDDDKNEVLNLILGVDEQGLSDFSKLFQNKEVFFKMAWFALKGDQAFDMLHDHYKGVIETSRKEKAPATPATKTKLHFKSDGKLNSTGVKTKKKDDSFSIEDHV